MYHFLPLRRLVQTLIAWSFAVSVPVFGLFYCFPQRQTVPPVEDAVRVMTFNVFVGGSGENAWTNRRDIVAQTIAEYLPDSVGLQEATMQWVYALRFRLPEYECVAVGRNDGFDGETSAVFYLKDKYELLDSGTFWLSETPELPSKGWDASVNRVCTWVKLKNRDTGLTYVHMNAHFDNVGQLARRESAGLIVEKARPFIDAGVPVICTGDFNVSEGSEPYLEMTEELFGDAKFLAPDTMTGTTFNNFNPDAYRDRLPIDFIFCSEKVTPLVYKIVNEGIGGRIVSDHYPVMADVEIGAD